MSKRAVYRAPKPPTKAELERELPGLWRYLEDHRPGFAEELLEVVPPAHRTPMPTTAQRAAGYRFDVDEVDRFLRFCAKLRHIKGRRFAGRRFVPDLWQVIYIIAPLFGWLRPDGTRVFRTLYLEVPRKNGKSTLCAAMALYLLMADREPGAEVYSAARDGDQARAVFDVAGQMAKRSPALRQRLKVLIPSKLIRYEATASSYKALASDRDGLNKHGLNVHGAIVDELHVITDRDYIGTLETGTGSRDQPVVAFITTAGIPGESIVWEDKRAVAINVAAGTAHLEDLLGVIYCAPDDVGLTGEWRNPEVHRAANPGYGRSLRPDYLERQVANAEVNPAELNRFLRLHLDVPTDSVSGWLPLPVWDRAASIVDERDLRGARCYAGLDLSSSLDLSAFVAVFPDPDDELVDVVCRFWTPADTLAARAHRDRADYELWERQGFLLTTPGETISYDAIEDELKAFADVFDLRSVDYDPWGSKQLESHLIDGGLPMYALRQGFASLSPPMKEAAKLVTEQRLRHGGHPVLRWNVTGTLAVQDPAGNMKPDRKRSRNRIDGVAALLGAISGWQREVGGGRSAYEDRGVTVA